MPKCGYDAENHLSGVVGTVGVDSGPGACLEGGEQEMGRVRS